MGCPKCGMAQPFGGHCCYHCGYGMATIPAQRIAIASVSSLRHPAQESKSLAQLALDYGDVNMYRVLTGRS
jgi:hypothetical protein